MAAPPSEEVQDLMNKALKEFYYNGEDPGSDGGVEKLFRNAKKAGLQTVTRDLVNQFIAYK